jgi:hypothetical protein
MLFREGEIALVEDAVKRTRPSGLDGVEHDDREGSKGQYG